jgi:Uma2 family endonuclease
MVESARLCTADDLAAMPEDGLRYVLVRGELIAMLPTSNIHGEIALMLSLLIGNFVRANNLGRLYAAETGFKLTSDPDTVLAADFAFISQARAVPREGGLVPIAPDLAVEVVSPNDTRLELQKKIALYFRAGTRQVWIVYPRARAVYVYTAEDQVTIHTGESVIEGGDLLPNFRLPISQIFAVLDEP